MEQLTGLDTSFLSMETSTTYGHICALAIFDPSNMARPPTRDDVMDLIASRIHLMPPLRRRLVEVPLGIDHPYWIEDGDFDMDFHVRETGLAPPGDDRQLADLVSRIAARHLDRNKPLWELYMIEGLKGGLTAQFTKIHHSAIDGISGAEILVTLLDLGPEPSTVAPPKQPWRPETEPSQLEMLGRGAWHLAGTPIRGVRLGREAFTNLPELSRSLGLAGFPGVSVLDRLAGTKPDPILSEATTTAPRTIFNEKISRHRRFAFGSLSLADVKVLKDTFGVTVNDVVMALCSAALRRYLQDRKMLPEDPLVAMIPVSVRTEAQGGELGNQVAVMTASLHTDIADPVERLEAVHKTMSIAKEHHAALPATLQQDFIQFAPPAVAARAARVITRAAVAHLVEVPFNVIVSNVPGPQFPLYGLGAKLVGNFPASAIIDGVGLNITVMSYDGNLDFGLIGCRELVPDIWDMVDHLKDALEELLTATPSVETSGRTIEATTRPRVKSKSKPGAKPKATKKVKSNGKVKSTSSG